MNSSLFPSSASETCLSERVKGSASSLPCAVAWLTGAFVAASMGCASGVPSARCEGDACNGGGVDVGSQYDGLTETGDPACLVRGQSFEAALLPVNFFAVVDRSFSMAMTLNGQPACELVDYAQSLGIDARGECSPEPSRWSVVKDSMSDAFGRLSRNACVGFTAFPHIDNESSCRVENMSRQEDPSLALNADRFCAQEGNVTQFLHTLSRDEFRPFGGTPMRDAVLEAAAYLTQQQQLQSNRQAPTVMVLGTDGIRGECISNRHYRDIADIVQDLRDNHDIRTLVLGVALPSSEARAVLNPIAEAGGFSLPGPDAFYNANSGDGLRQNMQGIVASAAECTFALDRNLSPNEILSVTVNGVRVLRDAEEGWTYVSRNAQTSPPSSVEANSATTPTGNDRAAIQFRGALCTTMRAGSQIDVAYRIEETCDGQSPPDAPVGGPGAILQ